MAITVTHDNTSIECTKAVKCTNKCYIHCLDAENNIIAAFSKIEDFEAFTISGGDWSEPDESAIGSYSYARGASATASEYCATAIGAVVTASGNYSRAEGQYCEATAKHAQAIGKDCEASGRYSFAQGEEVKASEDYQFATGSYNENLEDSAFEIGRGEDNDPLNIFRVTNSGKVEAADDVIAKAKDNSPVSLVDLHNKVTPGDTGWITPTLHTGVSMPTSNGIRYRKRNGIVYIYGNVSIDNMTTSAIQLFTLPAGYRPTTGTLYHINTATGDRVARFNITTSGIVQLEWLISLKSSTQTTGAISWVNMAFSFPL